jgi:hypothetical protein
MYDAAYSMFSISMTISSISLPYSSGLDVGDYPSRIPRTRPARKDALSTQLASFQVIGERLTLEVGSNKITDPVSSSLSCGVSDNTFRVLGSESRIVARSESLPIDINE